MLKISEKTNFGLFLLFFIAEKGTASLLEVTKRWTFMSQGYLEEIAAALKKTGLIVGKKGKGGGYRLAQPKEKITALDIVRALDGLAIVETSTHVKMRDSSMNAGQAFSGWCVSRRLWGRVQQGLEKTLREITLADLVREGKEFRPHPPITKLRVVTGQATPLLQGERRTPSPRRRRMG